MKLSALTLLLAATQAQATPAQDCMLQLNSEGHYEAYLSLFQGVSLVVAKRVMWNELLAICEYKLGLPKTSPTWEYYTEEELDLVVFLWGSK